MAKPINENLQSVYIETEAGDMLPAMEHAGNKFAELIHAVTANTGLLVIAGINNL